MGYRSNEPYDDLPLLPPVATLETTAVLRRAIAASRALAEPSHHGHPGSALLYEKTARCRR